jgi:AraC-like DNA-binding protein
MQFETHEPPPPFSELIESIFHYKDFQPDHSIERVVPTGHVYLLFELDGMQRHTYDSKTLEPSATFQKAWVSGVHSNHLSISAHPNSEMFVIQFKAFGAYPFLQLPMADLAGRVIQGDQFPNKALYATRERLCSAETSEDKFAIADEWLNTNFDKKLLPPESLVDVVANLRSQPAVKLKSVIDSFDGTQKHLISQFKKYIGITPKQYQRVLRFNDVFVQMQGDQFLKWSDIAYLCGYSDQSHFIREFKNFSGFIPEDFLREEFDDEEANFFPLDRGK